MTGKNKCKILKEIRSKIAKENDIPFITSQCTYQGDCKGTCPKCEQELVYLEQQLAKRRQLGKMVTVSALALGFAVGSVGCRPKVLEGDVPYIAETEDDEAGTVKPDSSLRPSFLQEGNETVVYGYASTTETEEIEMLEGDVAWSEDETEEIASDVLGMLPMSEETEGE